MRSGQRPDPEPVQEPVRSPGERPDALLATFLAHDAGALTAARSLRAGAEVAIAFTDLAGDWRIRVDGHGTLSFEEQPAVDPDFALRIPPGALRAICCSGAQDLGELGAAFLAHLHGVEPARRIDVRVHSGIARLAQRGWLALLAQGGTKVALAMGRAGLRGPGAVGRALARLRRG